MDKQLLKTKALYCWAEYLKILKYMLEGFIFLLTIVIFVFAYTYVVVKVHWLPGLLLAIFTAPIAIGICVYYINKWEKRIL